MITYKIGNLWNFEFSKLWNFESLYFFEIVQFQKFDYFKMIGKIWEIFGIF